MPTHTRSVPTCHHLFPDHHRCGSPSLRGEAFCYYHHPDRPSATGPTLAVRVGPRRGHRGFQITAPTDRHSLQKALNEVLIRLASNKLDVHRASLILYSLQIAAQSLNAS